MCRVKIHLIPKYRNTGCLIWTNLPLRFDFTITLLFIFYGSWNPNKKHQVINGHTDFLVIIIELIHYLNFIALIQESSIWKYMNNNNTPSYRLTIGTTRYICID